MASSKKICFFVLFILVFPVLLCTTRGLGDAQMFAYRIEQIDVTVSIPYNWDYADRSITDNDYLCKVFNMTAKEYIENYLSGNQYMLAFDNNTSTYMTLEVIMSGTSDYSIMTDSQIIADGENMYYMWFESAEDTVFSSTVFNKQGNVFYKLGVESSDLVFFHYVHVENRKKYVVTFSLEAKDYDESVGKLYDSIVESMGFPKMTEIRVSENAVADDEEKDFELFHLGDGYCLMAKRENYVYTLRGDKDADYTEQFFFDHDDHAMAMVYYDGFVADIISYPRLHKKALSDNECLSEIITYAKGGFGYTSRSFTIYALDNHCFFITYSSDKIEGTNVEFMNLYFFHKNGIVEISSNRTFKSDSERERMASFLIDIANSIWPLEKMPDAE